MQKQQRILQKTQLVNEGGCTKQQTGSESSCFVSMCIFLITSEINHRFVCLLAFCISFCVKCVAMFIFILGYHFIIELQDFFTLVSTLLYIQGQHLFRIVFDCCTSLCDIHSNIIESACQVQGVVLLNLVCFNYYRLVWGEASCILLTPFV